MYSNRWQHTPRLNATACRYVLIVRKSWVVANVFLVKTVTVWLTADYRSITNKITSLCAWLSSPHSDTLYTVFSHLSFHTAQLVKSWDGGRFLPLDYPYCSFLCWGLTTNNLMFLVRNSLDLVSYFYAPPHFYILFYTWYKA